MRTHTQTWCYPGLIVPFAPMEIARHIDQSGKQLVNETASRRSKEMANRKYCLLRFLRLSGDVAKIGLMEH